MERAKYYESLGRKSTDVTPAIEIALQGDSIDVCRLQKLCLWVRIPHSYRTIIWKIVLKVIPSMVNCWNHISNNRLEQFVMIRDCVSTIRDGKLTQNCDLSPEFMVYMLILQCSPDSSIKIAEQLKERPNEALLQIAKTFFDICDNTEDHDAFWLYAKFCMATSILVPKDFSRQYQHFDELIQSRAPDIDCHLIFLDISCQSFLDSWFKSYFSSVLQHQVLEGLWRTDKNLGHCCRRRTCDTGLPCPFIDSWMSKEIASHKNKA